MVLQDIVVSINIAFFFSILIFLLEVMTPGMLLILAVQNSIYSEDFLSLRLLTMDFLIRIVWE